MDDEESVSEAELFCGSLEALVEVVVTTSFFDFLGRYAFSSKREDRPALEREVFRSSFKLRDPDVPVSSRIGRIEAAEVVAFFAVVRSLSSCRLAVVRRFWIPVAAVVEFVVFDIFGRGKVVGALERRIKTV